MVTTTADRPATDDAVRTPTVLAVLVVRDGVRWLRECLRSLADQRYPRFGVVAVDNASTDGSRDVLMQALGERRVLVLDEDRGIAGALRAAAELPAVQAADYVLILHDDSALAPDAVARLVEAAEGIHGVERVAIVGPKVVDWDDPRVLREVGRSVDAFGHPYSPLQEGERDQGQYDRVLEVLFVSSCAMLVAREAWERTGHFDERYGGHHDDLDFCWRARVAGYRVLMTPLAQVRHADASARGQRDASHRRRSSRYYAERSGLASMLKDYGLVTLAWLLPLYAVAGAVRLVLLALGRRFEDAFDLLAAWAWNLVHLPGTIRRRVRVQSVRQVRDRHVRRFMASAFRMPRWFERAEEILDEQLEEGEAEEVAPLSERAASLAVAHPVLVGSALGLALGALAVRHFLGPEPLQGGALALWPPNASGFWQELSSGVRTTLLGGTQPASPALAGLGGLSWLTFASTTLAQKALLMALMPIAAVTMYRALVRQIGRPAPAAVGAAVYALSGVAMWAFSQGRIPVLVLMAALPAAWDRLESLFASERPDRPGKAVVSLGVAVAVGFLFYGGALLALAPIVVILLLAGRRRGRGLALAALAALAAAALGFLLLPDVLQAPAPMLGSLVGTTDPWRIVRLAPGTGPGSWALAAFLPASALVCFAIVGREHRGRAWRAMLLALAGIALAWASAARWLPEAFRNQPAYLVLAGVAMAALVTYGLATLGARIGREEFGVRQIAAAVLAIVLSVGIGAQALQAALAEWEVSPNGLPPAWPIVDASAPGPFRIVWLGRADGEPFPAPGGDATEILEAGTASIRYALTGREGTSALDIGRGAHGDGYAFLHEILSEIVAGSTRHGGQLLGPLGVRFIVGDEGDVPPAVLDRLEQQQDLYRVPAGGLVIYRNPRALPVASVVEGDAFAEAAAGTDLAALAAMPQLAVSPLRREGDAWVGETPAGTAYLAEGFAEAWRVSVDGSSTRAEPAFGWALQAPVAAGSVEVAFDGGWARTAQLVVLGLLWVAALWITRKPAER